MAPGAMHHARWMMKAIYSIKIWIFRSQFKLTAREERGLHEICVFVVRLYIKAWFTAPLAASAANNDLLFMQQLVKYESISPSISKVASS